jgi:recombination protein RecA
VTNENLSEQLEELVGDLNKQMKSPGLMISGLSQAWSDVTGWLKSGSTLLDAVMTSIDEHNQPVGSGFALGRWYEVYGPESVGKSTIVEHLMVECQRVGGIPVLIDSEAGFYKPRAVRMGLDPAKYLMIEATYLEKGIEAMSSMLEAIKNKESLRGRPVLIAWDTIASCPTKREFEEGTYAGGMAEKPRILRGMVRDFASQLPGYSCCLVLVNQIGATFSSYGKQTDTGGGMGPKYQSSVRLSITKSGTFQDPYNPESVAGINMVVKFEKSKLFKPLAVVTLPLVFETGIDDLLSVINFHVQYSQLVKNAQGRYKCPAYQGDAAPGKYLRDFMDLVKEDELFKDFLVSRVREHVHLLWGKPKSDKEK